MPNGNYYAAPSASWDTRSLRQSAIDEITRQLDEQNGRGAVWVNEWKEWYQYDLGTIRQFIESLPDLFTVVPEGDRKYRVELNRHSHKGYGKGRSSYKGAWGSDYKGGGALGVAQGGFRSGPQGLGFGWGKGGGFWSKTTADAIKEIKAELVRQGGTGKVWVDDWPTRFQPELGTLRQFLEARYDKFQINHGKGASFTVSLVGYEEEEQGGGSWGKGYASKGGSWGKGYASKGEGEYKPSWQPVEGEYKPSWQPIHKTTDTYDAGGTKTGKRWVPKEVDETQAESESESEPPQEEPKAAAEVEEGERPSAFDDPIDDELDSPK